MLYFERLKKPLWFCERTGSSSTTGRCLGVDALVTGYHRSNREETGERGRVFGTA